MAAQTTQNSRVLDYMKRFGHINQLEALRDLSVMRLASRINDLKDEGYMIRKRMVKGVNRFGEKVTYAEYSLVEMEVNS